MTIPESVTSIGNSAFADCKQMTSVTISRGVKDIGSHAFDGCSSLAVMVLPEGLAAIEDSSFKDCAALENIVIMGDTTSVTSNIFDGCSSLARIYGRKDSPVEQLAKDQGYDFTPIAADGTVLPKTEVIMKIPDTSPLGVGMQQVIAPVFSDGEDYDVSFIVDDPTVASIEAIQSMPYVLTANSLGQTRVTAYVPGTDIRTTFQVTVVYSIRPGEIHLQIEQSETLSEYYYLADGVQVGTSAVRWSSSHPSVAIVDDEGNVVGVNSGTALITCYRAADQMYATCTVSVYSPVSEEPEDEPTPEDLISKLDYEYTRAQARMIEEASAMFRDLEGDPLGAEQQLKDAVRGYMLRPICTSAVSVSMNRVQLPDAAYNAFLSLYDEKIETIEYNFSDFSDVKTVGRSRQQNRRWTLE